MSDGIRIGSHNDYDDATLTVSVTVVTGFEVEKTQNTVRTDTLRSVNTASPMVVTGVLPQTRVGSWLHIPVHSLKGCTVQLQLYSDAGASVLALNAGTVNVPFYTATEPFVNSRGSNDPFASKAPIVLFFAETSYRSFKLTFDGTPDDVSYYEVGRIRLMRYWEMLRNAAFGAALGRITIEDRVRTQGGTLRGNQSATIRTYSLDLNGIEDDEYATLDDVFEENGTTGEVSISLYGGENSRREAIWTGAGTLSALNAIGRQVRVLTNKIQFESN